MQEQEGELLHQFLFRLITDPDLLRQYLYEDDWAEIIDASGLAEENKIILRTGDLRAAMDVVRKETGGDVIFWVIMKWVI
jgi:hypothetical protein